MAAPRGGKKPGDRKAARPAGKRVARAGRAVAPRAPAPPFDAGFPLEAPRSFRPAPEYRPESSAGLRQEIGALRAEVQRLAAEIDKLWARERGRGLATPGRTARSIAGKPVRTGTRAGGPRRPGVAPGPAPAGAKRVSTTRGATGKRAAGSPKRSTGAKRSAGWAKPKSQSRRSGTTPRRKGR
jgi:hypothetical protein